MNAPQNTPEYTLGIHFTRRGKTVFIGVATFLCSGVFLLGSAIPTTDAPALSPAASTWTAVTQSLGDALAEGEDYGTSRAWESCLTDGRTILCPDGFTQPLF